MAQEWKEKIKVCVIFDDQAALPLTVSDQLRILAKQPLFQSITIGQAFGGTYESINLQTALQFATQELRSDLIVISVGPGVVGTGTAFGFSGISLANWANVVGALKGIPIWVPRLSFADQRKRHQGLSHHTKTALFQFTYASSVLPLPYLHKEQKALIQKQLELSDSLEKHQVRWAEVDMCTVQLERALVNSSLAIETMGRNYSDDPVFFQGVAEATRTALFDFN